MDEKHAIIGLYQGWYIDHLDTIPPQKGTILDRK